MLSYGPKITHFKDRRFTELELKIMFYFWGLTLGASENV
jgi:hypothetical protein